MRSHSLRKPRPTCANEFQRRYFRPLVEALEDRRMLAGATNVNVNDVPAADAADLAVSISRSPDPVAAGEEIQYEITVSNSGTATAENVRLTNVVPANARFLDWHQYSGPHFSMEGLGPGTGTFVASTSRMPSGNSATFRFLLSLSPDIPSGTSVSNTVSASTSTADSNLENNRHTDTTAVVTRSDLRVIVRDPFDLVPAGSNLSYRIEVWNLGPSDAENVTLTNLLPAHTTFVSMTQDFFGKRFTLTTPPAGGTGTVSASTVTMPRNSSSTFTLVVNVNLSLDAGVVISNTATVSSTTADEDLSNNSETTTTTAVFTSELRLTKSASGDAGAAAMSSITSELVIICCPVPFPTDVFVEAGDNLTYTITVTNAGPLDAQDVQLSDRLAAGITFVSITAPSGWISTTPPVGGTGTITSTTSTLAAGAAASFTLVVKIDANLPLGTLMENRAEVTTTTPEVFTSDNRDSQVAEVVTKADLSVVTSGAPDPVTSGSTLTYTITVANAGGSDAVDVRLENHVPSYASFVSLTAPSGWTATTPVPGNGSFIATKPSLIAGATETFTLVLRVKPDTVGDANGRISTRTEIRASHNIETRVDNNDFEDVDVMVPVFDFGDAPNTYGTTADSDGARHHVTSGLFLGSGVDVDGDGQPSDYALGDDSDWDGDDEDGVALPPALVAGLSASATLTSSADGFLDAWIDFDGSGVFDAVEQIAAGAPLIAGPNNISFPVPLNAIAGASFGRFRFSSAGGLTPTGIAVDGEVEDYQVQIAATTHGTAQTVDDPLNPGQRLLVVIGTSRNDRLVIESRRNMVRIRRNGHLLAVFNNAEFHRIGAIGLAGNDTIIVNSRIREPAELHGSDGNDRLFGARGNDSLYGESGNDSLYGANGHDRIDGGSGRDTLDGGLGHDLLLGAVGNDRLIGQTGRDILIGGAGSDFLHGGKDDDILISGTSDHDPNSLALLAILSEWMSNAPAPARIGHLSGSQSGGLNGASLFIIGVTVHDDRAADQLFGSLGSDWFLYFTSDADTVRDGNPRQDRLHRL